MRFLFISNFYPPASRGGFEQWCQEVALGLIERGHEVHVLTSLHGEQVRLNAADPEWVHRRLHLEMEIASLKNAFQFFTHRKWKERENLAQVDALLDQVRPDAALCWGMWNLHRSIPALLEERMKTRVAYYMGDYWPALPSPFDGYWSAPPRNVLVGIPKTLLKPIARAILARETRPVLNFEHVLFPSQYMLDEFKGKVGIQNAKIVYGAIDTRPYLNAHQEEHPKEQEGLTLLFIGRLTHDKGAHTAIQALGFLARTYENRNVHLKIVGAGEPDYQTFLQKLVGEEGLEEFVQFIPAQPKESLPSLYREADIFLFSSIWAEPFGRVLVEAMASGVPVIGTQVGGASEILVEDETGLTFSPGDARRLAEQIKRLIDSPSLRDRLARAARETAIERFDIRRMTNEIGAYLASMAQA